MVDQACGRRQPAEPARVTPEQHSRDDTEPDLGPERFTPDLEVWIGVEARTRRGKQDNVSRRGASSGESDGFIERVHPRAVGHRAPHRRAEEVAGLAKADDGPAARTGEFAQPVKVEVLVAAAEEEDDWLAKRTQAGHRPLGTRRDAIVHPGCTVH